MKMREAGRVASILGAVLTFFVGFISVVLGTLSSTPEQSGWSLVVRGLVLMLLSAFAGYGASISNRRPDRAVLYLVGVAVLGSIAAFRSFWVAAAVLIVAGLMVYSSKDD
jgi:hypothetical protein